MTEPMKSLKQPAVKLSFFTLSILFTIFPISWVYGQNQEVDAVYLINGEVFRGFLQDQPDPDQVQLETLCWNTRIFSKREISRIEREKVNLFVKGYNTGTSQYGYFNRTDLGLLIGSGNNEKNAIFSVQMVNGYKIDRKYFPGIGIGIEFYEYAVVPVSADFSYYFSSRQLSPFLRGSFGYSIPIEDPPEQWGSHTDTRGGILYTAGIGTSIRTGTSSALVLSLLYRFQSLRSINTVYWNDDMMNIEKQYNRISFRVGFMFD